MTGSKYWGEEKYADAIYSVYLKKVRYVSPNEKEGNGTADTLKADQIDHACSNSADDFDHLQWETIRERVIKAGTLQKLVESLIDSEGQLDSRQFNIFFATYRTFSRTEEVLELIKEWFSSIPADIHPSCSRNHAEKLDAMRRIIKSILVCWLDMYPEDFYETNSSHETQQPKWELLERLINFSKAKNLHDLKHKARKLRDHFKNVHQNGGLTTQIPSINHISLLMTGYDPNVPSISSTSSNFPDVDNDERYAKLLAEAQARAQMFDIGRENVQQIAEQLTFWDALLFRDLKPYQCQGSIWGKRNKLNAEAVYSVRSTIDQFNSLCQRVMTSVVLPECSPEFRAQIIEKWILIARELRLLNNFSSLKAILSSLQSQPVYRLRNIWSLVPKNSMALFEELAAVVDNSEGQEGTNSDQNAKTSKKKIGGNCRRTKSDVNVAVESQGTVPYLGTFLTELVMIDQAFPDMTEEGLINFEKRRQEFEVLAKLRLYQSAARAYVIPPMDKAFCVWFNFLPALDEKDCFIRSAEIEPTGNEQSTPDSRRRVRDQMMPKINSLSKLFSGLGYSSAKELNCSPGSSFLEPKSIDKDNNGKRSSIESNVDRSSTVCSLSSTPQNSEKPPRGQRSRSQGAKKENRCKSNGIKGMSRPLVPSSTNERQPNLETETKYSVSEFSPQHFSNVTQLKQTTNIKSNANHGNGGTFHREFGFISEFRHNSGHTGETAEFLHRMNSLDWSPVADKPPPTFGSSSATSSFGRSLPMTQSNSKESATSSQKEILERLKQKSTSSSSSRSSFGKHFESASPSSISVSNCPREEQNFHLIRVALDDSVQEDLQATTNTNYKCIKVVNGDRMPQVVQRALEKHSIDSNESPNYCLVQLLPDGGEFRFPDHCNPFYAVAPDPTSPMLNCVLRKRIDCANSSKTSSSTDQHTSVAEAKKLNKEKRNNLLRWSSGFL